MEERYGNMKVNGFGESYTEKWNVSYLHVL
jgi:hypothetical protein